MTRQLSGAGAGRAGWTGMESGCRWGGRASAEALSQSPESQKERNEGKIVCALHNFLV